MAKPTEAKPIQRQRGTGFPVLSLPEAVKIIREAGTYGKTHTTSALAAYAGHQSATSGPWKQKEAALRDWGLITTVSSGTIGLTDRALQIALPNSPEDARKALLECFQNLTLYMDIYNDMAKGSDVILANLGNKAVTTYKITIASKEKFIKSFVESAAAVGLARNVTTEKMILVPIEELGKDESAPLRGAEIDSQAEPLPGEHATKTKKSLGNPIMHQIWSFEGGEVILSIFSIKPIQAETYKKLSEVVKTIETLVSELTVSGGEVQKDDSTD